MNIKKKSIIIPAFALLIGASLAGSVTGTIAWYQYSTRVNVAHYNVSGGTSGNLQMRIKDDDYGQNGDWLTTLTAKDIRGYLNTQGYGKQVLPITSGEMGKDDAAPADDGFHLNPIAGRGPYGEWTKAEKANFIRIPLQLRYVKRDGEFKKVNGVVTDDEEEKRDVYISDLVLRQDLGDNDHDDLSDALRFHVYSYQDEAAEEDVDPQNPADHIKDGSKLNHLISRQGGTTVVEGKLDLDGNGQNDWGYTDNNKYGNFDETGNNYKELIYGREYADYEAANYVSKVQRSYTSGNAVVQKKDDNHQNGRTYIDENGAEQAEPENIYPAVAEEDGDYRVKNLDYVDESSQTKSKAIGQTIKKDPTAQNYDDIKDDYLNVVITVWVEGWHQLVSKTPVLDDQGQPVLDTEQNPTYSQKISSIWSADFIGSEFNIGFEFGVNDVE